MDTLNLSLIPRIELFPLGTKCLLFTLNCTINNGRERESCDLWMLDLLSNI